MDFLHASLVSATPAANSSRSGGGGRVQAPLSHTARARPAAATF